MDPLELIQHFVVSMTQLMALMRQETDLVRSKQYDQVERIQRHKVKLAQAFETHQRAIKENLSAVETLSTEERSELRSLYQVFRETLSENMLALKAAQDATDKMVKLIINGVRKARGMPENAPTQKGRKASVQRGYGAYAAAGGSGQLMSKTF
jgi:transcriptional regulator of heat shock response